MVAALSHKDNHVRANCGSGALQLGKERPGKANLHDFDALSRMTKDKRFVTARHTLQALWKIGTAGKQQQQVVVTALLTDSMSALPKRIAP